MSTDDTLKATLRIDVREVADAAPTTAAPTGPKAVYAAIVQVTREMSTHGIGKDKFNEGQKFHFRGIDDVMNALSMRLVNANLCIIPRVVERTVSEHPSKSGGTLFYVALKVDFDLVSAVDGSMHTVTMCGEAMDSGDKATAKAQSVAFKYMALETFCIPVEGLPDADASNPEPAPAKPVIQPPKVAPAKKLGVEIVPAPKASAPGATTAASPAPATTGTVDPLKALMATMTEAGVFYGIEAKGKAREEIERERALRFLSRALKVEVKSRKDLTPAQIVTARGEAASWARLVTGLGKAAGLSTIAAFMETAIDRCGHHIDMPADMTEEEADALAQFLQAAKVPA